MKKYEYLILDSLSSKDDGGQMALDRAGDVGFRVIQSNVVPLDGGLEHKIVYVLERETAWKVGGPL